MNEADEVSRILEQIASRQAGLNELIPLVHGELLEIARRALRHEREGHTLSTGALVNEAYLRLVEQDHSRWQNRAHFLAIASVAMRRVLVRHAEARLAAKRGGGVEALPLEMIDAANAEDARAQELVGIDQLLERFAEIDPRAARVVECRFFAGLTVEETAETLALSVNTVKRDWAVARAWLQRELKQAG